MEKAAKDNRANQLNPKNDKYWQARGENGKPVVTPEVEPTVPAENPTTQSTKTDAK